MNKKLMLKSLKLFTWLLFILYLVALIYVIVLKNGRAFIYARDNAEIYFIQKLTTINVIPFKTIFNYLRGNESFSIAIQNILGNIFAFGPLGFLLPILFDKYKNAKNIFFISVTVSLSIEIVQLLFTLGSCDIDDLILNVLGSILGFGVYKLLNQMVKKDLDVTSIIISFFITIHSSSIESYIAKVRYISFQRTLAILIALANLFDIISVDISIL